MVACFFEKESMEKLFPEPYSAESSDFSSAEAGST